MSTPPISPESPEWLQDIIDALDWTDGIHDWTLTVKDGAHIFTLTYGEETFQFTAGNDGQSIGAAHDRGVHDLTEVEQVHWWIAGQLYDRLQKAKQELLAATSPKPPALAPCKYCGGKGEDIWTSPVENTDVIRCVECGAETEGHEPGTHQHIQAWNNGEALSNADTIAAKKAQGFD